MSVRIPNRRAGSKCITGPNNGFQSRLNRDFRIDAVRPDLFDVGKGEQLRRLKRREQDKPGGDVERLPPPPQAAIPSSAIAASRLWTIASKNCSVVSQGCSGPTRMARSFVIWPPSTVSMQTRSSVSANRTTSGESSNFPRYLRPPVQAKIEAIGLVEVALPCWCMR